MQRWWRWTWRGWLAALCGLFVFAIAGGLFAALSPPGIDGASIFFDSRFSWGETVSYVRLAALLVAGGAWAWITARLQIFALRADFPGLDTARWMAISIVIAMIAGALDIVAFEPLRADAPQASMPYLVAFDGLTSIVMAWLLWRFVLRSEATGMEFWLGWYTAGGFLTSALIAFGDIFLVGDDTVKLGITIFALLLGVAVIGIGAATIRPRHRALERVFL